MAVKFQFRYDTAANWTSNNPTLLAGEIGIESDTKKMKVGDGTTAWTSLAYAFVTTGSPTITTSIVTSSGSFDLINTNAATINFAGAATALNIGASTGTLTIGNPTITATNATALALNGASPSITTTSTATASVFNTNATTLNIGGAATTIAIGAATGTTTINNALALSAGTTTKAPLDFASGTNLTTASAGAVEYDGSFFYATRETTSGRGSLSVNNIFRLASNGSTISSISNFFGTTSAINLAAGSVYEVEFYGYFTKTTAGTVTWTMTSSSAPTHVSAFYVASPVTGIGTVGGTTGTPVTAWTAATTPGTTLAFAATGSLTTGVNHTVHIKATIFTNLATTFTLQATSATGTITPLAGSYYTVKRISSSQGSFA